MITGNCRSCSAPIIWAMVADKYGRTHRHLVDREQVPGGNMELVDQEGSAYQRVRFVPIDRDVLRYQSHFASCPQAGRWREVKR